MLPLKGTNNASSSAAAPVGGRDHISNLPDCVLLHLLSFLPALDVVRTCVLAKRWRHTWKSTTVLRFMVGETDEPDALKKSHQFVYHLLRLRLRGGTPLHICEFGIGEIDDAAMRRTNLWIRIALQCKVQVLRLDCAGVRPLYDHPIFISQYLKKLELHSLYSLDEIMPSRFLDFSCCPVLEDLEPLYYCLGGALLISSQSLKRLTIKCCGFPDGCRLPICAPNLVSLWLQVGCGWSMTPLLQRMPSLITAFVKYHSYDDWDSAESNDDDYSNQSILFQGLSEVQNLVLMMSPDTYMFFLRRGLEFCSNFNKLKSLLFDEYWCEPADFGGLACLLKLSLVLEKLTLQLYSKGPKHNVELKLSCKPLEMSVEISQHLNTLEVKCEVYDDRIRDVLTFLSKQLDIFPQIEGSLHEDGPTITYLSHG